MPITFFTDAFWNRKAVCGSTLTLKERATGVGTPMKLDGKASEVFALVDLVTERVSTELDLDSLFDRNRPVSEVATSSLDSFRAYQRGVGDLQDGRNQAATTAA